jgi:hypothetical protein
VAGQISIEQNVLGTKWTIGQIFAGRKCPVGNFYEIKLEERS